MTTPKMLLAISAVTVALAAPVAAQQAIFLPSNSLLMVDRSGQATVVGAGRMARSMMSRSGRPASSGFILYNDGSRLYAMADRRMAGGKMLSQMFRDDFLPRAGAGKLPLPRCRGVRRRRSRFGQSAF